MSTDDTNGSDATSATRQISREAMAPSIKEISSMSDSYDKPKRTVTRRDFLRSTAVAGTAALLAACGSAPASVPSAASTAVPAAVATAAPAAAAPAPSGSGQPTTISMWTHDKLYVKFFTSRGEEWKKTKPEYSDITFDFQQVPEVFTKVLANLSAGQEIPDLFGLEQGQFPNFMKDDIIEQKFVDLTPRIGNDRDKFVESSWTKYTHKGKIFGVESGLSASVLYYQPALLEKAGVEVPKTWEDMPMAAGPMAKQGVAFLAFHGEDWGSFAELFFQRGGAFFNNVNDFVLGNPENRSIAVEVLKFVKDGIDKKYIKTFSAADFWAPPTFAAYKDGSVAGIVMPEWYSDALLKAQVADMEGQWRIAQMPSWKAGGHKTSTWGGTGFTISNSSENVDVVWDLLHYTYMTKESQIKRFQDLKYMPTMLEAFADPAIASVTDPYYGGQQIGQIFADIASDVPVWYQSTARGPMNDALTEQLTLFFTGQGTAEEAIDSVVATTQQELPS